MRRGVRAHLFAGYSIYTCLLLHRRGSSIPLIVVRLLCCGSLCALNVYLSNSLAYNHPLSSRGTLRLSAAAHDHWHCCWCCCRWWMKHLLHLHITAIYTLLAQPLLSGRGLHAYKIGFTTQYFAFIYLKHFFSFLLQQIIGHHLIISFDTQFYSRKKIFAHSIHLIFLTFLSSGTKHCTLL